MVYRVFSIPQDFILCIDVLNCKCFTDKLRWAFNFYDQDRLGYIDMSSLFTIIPLMDQVVQPGFMEGATEEELDEINYRSKPDPFQKVEVRARNVWDLVELNSEGRVDLEEFLKAPERAVHARAYD